MDSVFVYGQKVKDFHTIDANAVFAITTSAVQAIDHIVQSEKAKVAILETQLTDVLARLSVLENK